MDAPRRSPESPDASERARQEAPIHKQRRYSDGGARNPPGARGPVLVGCGQRAARIGAQAYAMALNMTRKTSRVHGSPVRRLPRAVAGKRSEKRVSGLIGPAAMPRLAVAR